MPSESSSLLSSSPPSAPPNAAPAGPGPRFGPLLLALQTALLVFFAAATKHSDAPYSHDQYVAFRDVMAMLLLGFGFLMTFLRRFGLSAVGFTLLLAALSMQLNLAAELACRLLAGNAGDPDTVLPMPVSLPALIDAEFAAATLLISFGALIGRVSPLQMLIVCVAQSAFYAFNKAVLVLGAIAAEDVGGSITIHMFGAYFGLAASLALGPAPDRPAAAHDAALPDKVSDLLALLGTAVLWLFWPSFVGATETAAPQNEHRCLVNTVLALLGSTVAAFYLSHKLNRGKLDPVHIANSTLAGGVAIGSAARLDISPAGALLTGFLAGAVSVGGYVYSSPFLEQHLGIADTCGVGNLHGYPSVVGALLSVAFVALHSGAPFLKFGVVSLMARQLAAIFATLVVSVASGYLTGKLAAAVQEKGVPSYEDCAWWHLEY